MDKLILNLACAGVPVLAAIDFLLDHVDEVDKLELMMIRKALIKSLD